MMRHTQTPRYNQLHHLFVFVPILFYYYTASRTPGWLDATMIVSNVVNLELGSWVNMHNLFHVTGYFWLKLFPGTNIHYYLVLLSGLLGALTVYLIFLAGIALTGNKPASLLGALTLMLSHSLWWHSSTLEVYTMNAFFIALVLLFVIRFNKSENINDLLWAVFFWGLGCTNHVLIGLFCFAFLSLLLTSKRALIMKPRNLLRIGLVFSLAFSLYIFVFAKDYTDGVAYAKKQKISISKTTLLKNLVHDATGGPFKANMFPEHLDWKQKLFWRAFYLLLLIYNFPSMAFFMGFWGLFLFYKNKNLRLSFIFFSVGLLAQVVWSANYLIWDMYAFAMPVYILFSIPIMIAIDFAMRHYRKSLFYPYLLTFCTPLVLYPYLPKLILSSEFADRQLRNVRHYEQVKDFWNPIQYILDPNKRNFDEVDRYMQRLFTILPDGADFWDDDGKLYYPLHYYYQGVLNLRKDIRAHLILSPYFNDKKARQHALSMKQALDTRGEVYISSLTYPERRVLDYLYYLSDAGASLNHIMQMPAQTLIRTFPKYRIQSIELVGSVPIYKISP